VVALPKITFAMIELADPKDCNDRKKGWKRLKFQDITPELAKRRKVPSLNGKTVESVGEDLIQNVKGVNAHWYLLSGHHGRLYAADIDRFTNPYDYYSKQDFAGFFNNDYHHGRWEKVWRDPARLELAADSLADPDWRKRNRKVGAHFDHELYLSTTAHAPSIHTGDQFFQTNPLIDSHLQSRRKNRCLGLILSACNTLSFTAVRKYWQANYPDSIIFGTFRTIGHGYQVTNAIARSRMTDRKFWRSPSEVLTGDDACEELAMQIARKFPRSRRDFGIGFIWKGNLWVSRFAKGKTKVEKYTATADLPLSKAPWS